jgi:hypothetical protein
VIHAAVQLATLPVRIPLAVWHWWDEPFTDDPSGWPVLLEVPTIREVLTFLLGLHPI